VTPLKVTQPGELRGIDSPIANDKRALWCLLYGLDRFDKLFTTRQLLALITFSDLVHEARKRVLTDTDESSRDARRLAEGGTGRTAYADAVATYLTLGVSKLADNASALCSWHSGAQHQKIRATFGRQGLPMVWDFAEGNVFSTSTGNFLRQLKLIVEVMEFAPATNALQGTSEQLDATASLLSTPMPIVSTDPPYYDNIGYADLSDYFYVWLRRMLMSVFPSLFATLLTPKSQELIASPYRHDGSKTRAQEFFEKGLGDCFSRTSQVHSTEFPQTVYYAFKQTEADDDSDDEDIAASGHAVVSTGWETMLAGLVRSGFSITGTWPIRTELGNRMVGMGTNALASSIVLVCRPRPENASLATRKEFITALRRELPEALRNLQRGNIAPVDLAQAAIGPGMAVFTRYAKVLESDGSPMTVRTALGLINQSLDEVLAEQEGEFDSDTRWALAWFEQFGMDDGPFGDAETLSKAKNTAINGLVEAGVIVAKAGKVRLVKREELPTDWNPATDKRITVWEVTQHLIRRLDEHGESGAATLISQLGSEAEIARDLAYRLYSTCERKKWAQDALAYNSLVIAWPELSKLALSSRIRQSATQHELF
jgi:putative DNA methylase